MPATPRRYSALSLFTVVLFTLFHVLAVALPFVVGVSWQSVALAVALYWLRMFGITAGYHRYFAHRSYKAPRWFQLVLAWVGAMSVQKGPLWWAGLHRVHHRWSDTPRDLHSPLQRGFWYSHVGWIVSPDHDGTDLSLIPDFAKFPELRFIDTYHWVPALVMAAACYLVDGWRGVVWGAGVSTVVLWHCTFTINSLAHTWGSRRYQTTDTSRNNFVLAILTMGEGWHNNHHHYMNSANQGFFWWEVDASYYILKSLSWVRVVRDLRRPPVHVLRPALVEVRERAVAKLTEVRDVAESKLAEARLVAGTAISEARLAAETRLTEVRDVAGARLTEARVAVNEAVTGAEQRIGEVKAAMNDAVTGAEQRIGEVKAAMNEAVNDAVTGAEQRIGEVKAAVTEVVENAADAVDPVVAEPSR